MLFILKLKSDIIYNYYILFMFLFISKKLMWYYKNNIISIIVVTNLQSMNLYASILNYYI